MAHFVRVFLGRGEMAAGSKGGQGRLGKQNILFVSLVLAISSYFMVLPWSASGRQPLEKLK